MKYYEVIGVCDVADVPPGQIVTSEQLDAARVQVRFLIGSHLKEVPDPAAEAARAPEPKKAEAKKP